MPVKDLVCSSIPIRIEPGAERLLDSAMHNIASRILEIISDEKREGLPVKSVELTAFVDPEGEGSEELVFSVVLESTADYALQAWDRLSDEVARLRGDLPLPDVELLDQRISINVEWD